VQKSVSANDYLSWYFITHHHLSGDDLSLCPNCSSC